MQGCKHEITNGIFAASKGTRGNPWNDSTPTLPSGRHCGQHLAPLAERLVRAPGANASAPPGLCATGTRPTQARHCQDFFIGAIQDARADSVKAHQGMENATQYCEGGSLDQMGKSFSGKQGWHAPTMR